MTSPDGDPELTTFLHSSMPLCAHLGMRASRFDADQVVLHLEWRPELCTTNGLLHGGAVMALADSCGGGAAFLNLPEGATGTATISSATSFLGGVTAGTITGTATVLHRGGSTIVVETAVTDESGRLVAKVVQSQAVLRPRG